MSFRRFASVLGILFFVFSCKKGSVAGDTQARPDTASLPNDKSTWWRPAAAESFDWELDDITSSDVFTGNVVDADAFTTSAETVASLHAKNKKVIAYLSVGTIENDRPDAFLLPPAVVGKTYPEWPNEKWIDIRQIDKLKPWLNSRINMILLKGFDAIEPDNLDGYANSNTGFDLSIGDTKRYLDTLLLMAHLNGLGIGQKNVPELSATYAPKLDWALTEDAFFQGWQKELAPYTGLNKPVFAVEYTDNTSEQVFESMVCPAAAALGYTAILKKRDLGAWVHKCK